MDLLNLPTELLSKILGMVNLKSIQNMVLTCKKFKEIMFIHNYKRIEILKLLYKYSYKLHEKLSIFNYDPRDFNQNKLIEFKLMFVQRILLNWCILYDMFIDYLNRNNLIIKSERDMRKIIKPGYDNINTKQLNNIICLKDLCLEYARGIPFLKTNYQECINFEMDDYGLGPFYDNDLTNIFVKYFWKIYNKINNLNRNETPKCNHSNKKLILFGYTFKVSFQNEKKENHLLSLPNEILVNIFGKILDFNNKMDNLEKLEDLNLDYNLKSITSIRLVCKKFNQIIESEYNNLIIIKNNIKECVHK